MKISDMKERGNRRREGGEAGTEPLSPAIRRSPKRFFLAYFVVGEGKGMGRAALHCLDKEEEKSWRSPCP